MASIGIHSSGTNLVQRPSFFTPRQNLPLNPFLHISNKTKKPQTIRASSPALASHLDKNTEDSLVVETIDHWMHESVSEIVKNLKRAPLLVQLYSGNEGGEKKVTIQTEKAVLENWAAMKGKWGNRGSKQPDGLIFVEELGQEFGDGVTRAWGIVIQGQGLGCGPTCYLLKTNSVCAGIGLGSCTHFCLMRADNLRGGVFQQFRDSWLVT